MLPWQIIIYTYIYGYKYVVYAGHLILCFFYDV